MDQNLQFIWIEEILSKCNMCKIAVKRIKWYEQKRFKIEDEGFGTDIGFEAISSFFYQAAGISHILWPQVQIVKGTNQKSKNQELKRLRGESLRKLLKLDEPHLLSNRAMRNHFAHMDERIDQWGETSTHRNYAGKLWDDVTISGQFDSSDQFEQYLPKRNIVIFHGSSYSITDYETAVNDIYDQAAPHSRYQDTQRRLKELEERRCEKFSN